MNMIDNEFRHFQREKKKERKEGDSAVEKRVGGSDKHKQWSNLSRWIYSSTAMINSKGICSYNRSFRVFFFLTRICSYCFWFAFFFFQLKNTDMLDMHCTLGFFFFFYFFMSDLVVNCDSYYVGSQWKICMAKI